MFNFKFENFYEKQIYFTQLSRHFVFDGNKLCLSVNVIVTLVSNVAHRYSVNNCDISNMKVKRQSRLTCTVSE